MSGMGGTKGGKKKVGTERRWIQEGVAGVRSEGARERGSEGNEGRECDVRRECGRLADHDLQGGGVLPPQGGVLPYLGGGRM